MLTCLPDPDSGWLTAKVGEILHATDDSPQTRPYRHPSRDLLAYEALNAAGKVGCE
jgi:hypothetical protein